MILNNMEHNSALVVVDMLYDFIDGSLACQNAENAVAETVKFINKVTKNESSDENEIRDIVPVLFIRDHHPQNHSSFKEFGGIWPAHCVIGTRGGEIHEDLKDFAVEELIFDKGTNVSCEQYSGYEGINNAGQSLGEVLDLLDVSDVYVCGIATEYCVRNTCEDLLKNGKKVHLLQNCIAYVDLEGHKAALQAMSDEGIILTD